MDEPLKRIRSARCQQCHNEGGRVGTIGALGGPGHPVHHGGLLGKQQYAQGPWQGPAVLNKFTNADAKFFYVFKLDGTESTGHDANKTLDLSVILMTNRNRSTLPMRDRVPMGDGRVERGDGRGHHNMI